MNEVNVFRTSLDLILSSCRQTVSFVRRAKHLCREFQTLSGVFDKASIDQRFLADETRDQSF